METLDPILQPSPITVFEMQVLFPILVPFPITVNGPISALRDCAISKEQLVC